MADTQRNPLTAWETDLTRCDHEGCMKEGTEPLRGAFVCPDHLQAAFDAEYDRQRDLTS